jgi:hypothetical protein
MLRLERTASLSVAVLRPRIPVLSPATRQTAKRLSPPRYAEGAEPTSHNVDPLPQYFQYLCACTVWHFPVLTNRDDAFSLNLRTRLLYVLGFTNDVM